MVEKIQSVNVNLDRWRQEKTSFGRRYVYINIPSFMLRVIENDTVIFSSKVIVGAVETPTPDISSVIECFTIYPYWHVPRKIAVEEYLPVIQKDTTFITRNNFEVLDRKGKVLNPDSIDWAKYHKNYFPVVLRQREGEENSLGIIKFVFDNPYAVYVHDTNAKRLFSSSRRAFSHGCIRMERAVELAHYLVNGSLKNKSKVVEKYIKEKQRHTVNLRTPMPIFIRYFTAEVVNNEFLHHKDVYNKDEVWNEVSVTAIQPGSQK
jgi:murein L,D-transpeptidase YcbB/YkuD